MIWPTTQWMSKITCVSMSDYMMNSIIKINIIMLYNSSSILAKSVAQYSPVVHTVCLKEALVKVSPSQIHSCAHHRFWWTVWVAIFSHFDFLLETRNSKPFLARKEKKTRSLRCLFPHHISETKRATENLNTKSKLLPSCPNFLPPKLQKF